MLRAGDGVTINVAMPLFATSGDTSLDYLTDYWREANARWFRGKLTPVPIISAPMYNTTTLGTYGHDAHTGKFRIEMRASLLRAMDMPEWYWEATGTLLHEMIHQYLHQCVDWAAAIRHDTRRARGRVHCGVQPDRRQARAGPRGRAQATRAHGPPVSPPAVQCQADPCGGGGMTDARFPERWLNDARLQRVPAGAYRLFGNSLMWAVSNRTDGHVPAWALTMIPHATEADAKELAAAGLWADGHGGWVIADYEDTQSTRDDLEVLANARKRQRDKKRRQRAGIVSPGTVPGYVPRDSTRTGQDRPGALKGTGDVGANVAANGAGSCLDDGCSRPPRHGCRTCFDHAYLELAR